MDVNMSADVKAFGLPVVPAVELEDRSKAPVTPVQESSGSEQGKLDQKTLHGREAAKKEEPLALSKQEVGEYVEDIQNRLDTMGSRLRFGFRVDDKSKSIVFTVTDRDTGEMVKQVPSEEVMELRRKLEDLVGLLFDKKA